MLPYALVDAVVADGPATAVVVTDGVITFVGSDEEAVRLAPADRTLRLGGRWLTPGFVDAHVHTVQTGQVLDGLDLTGAVSATDCLDRLAAFVARHPGRYAVVGHGWDERSWPEGRPPTAAELQRAGGGRPVYLARVDVHSAVVSTALLDRIERIAAEPGFTATGWLYRDAHHRARAAVDALFTDADRRGFARAALDRAAALGVTGVHELGGPFLGPVEDLARVVDAGRAAGVETTTYWGELARGDDDPVLARAARLGVRGLAGDLSVDGAIGSRTAALTAPYADSDGTGFRYLSLDQITAHVLACTRAGLQAGFHCIGDDAVSACVEGLVLAAEVLGAAPIRAARHRLEHVEMLDPAHDAALADLDVTVSMQPAFDALWGGPGELYATRLGRRADQMNRFGSLHRAGVPLAFGTDSPVTRLAGWATVRAAVEHWRPDERLPLADALAIATRGGHRAAADDRRGHVAVGAPVDLALWNLHDPTALDLDAPPGCVTTVIPATPFEHIHLAV